MFVAAGNQSTDGGLEGTKFEISHVLRIYPQLFRGSTNEQTEHEMSYINV